MGSAFVTNVATALTGDGDGGRGCTLKGVVVGESKLNISVCASQFHRVPKTALKYKVY